MTMSRAVLLEALGFPVLGKLVPLSRDPAWRVPRMGLFQALMQHDVPHRFRSPSSLWALLHGGPMPAMCTWERLLEGQDFDSLLSALGDAGGCSSWRLSSWNLRWLVSSHTDKAARKRALLRRWLQSRRVVLLGETHWFDADVATWSSAFPGSRVFAAPAVRGPRGGPSGGVAVILPQGYSLDSWRILVPGYAVEVLAHQQGAESTRFVSMYLPDGGQRLISGTADSPIPAGGRPAFLLHRGFQPPVP